MYITIFLVFVFFICLAMIFNEGLWGTTITFFNVMTAALLATNYFEPLAKYLTGQWAGATFFWDFVALWGIFVGVLIVLRLVTDKFLSRHKVRYLRPLDVAGGTFVAAWIGWIMVQFSLFSLHLAPLDRNFLGFQSEPDEAMFFGLAPDRNWLAFVHTMSESGSLARDPPRVFDPTADFILKYGGRRQQFEKQTSLSAGGR